MQPRLKYLFIAEFVGGKVIKQNPQDKPQNPQGKNCFSDVLEALQNGEKLKKFSVGNSEQRVTVDLLTGIFYHNDFPLLLESEKLPTFPESFDLIWYHQITRDKNITYNIKTGAIVKTEEPPEFREYFIGWKCNINGKSYQQKLAIA